ncbi:hypothetical protein ACSBR2_007548 [Camellia fascicularis]
MTDSDLKILNPLIYDCARVPFLDWMLVIPSAPHKCVLRYCVLLICLYVATTLTSWHLLVTFCSLHVALWMKFFEHKPFDRKVVTGFGILNGISIRLLNLSLCFNSVGFYQMTKLAIIPCAVLLETLFFSKKFNRRIQLSLSILLLGVGIATVTYLQLNIMGSILSLLAVVTTCVAQIDTNKHAVYSLLVFVILLQLKVFIVLSCLIAVSVNFSTFLVIGKTSPVMYQAKEGESDPLMSARKV